MKGITKFVGPDSNPATPVADLVRPATWQPLSASAPVRIELMAIGKFTDLGRSMVVRLRQHLAARGAFELRLSEIRQACVHFSDWSPDPLPGTVPWVECIKLDPAPRPQSMLTIALQESVRHQVDHVVLFAGSFSDAAFSAREVGELLRAHSVRLSLFQAEGRAGSQDVLATLAAATGGLVERERGAAALVPRLATFIETAR